MRVMMGVPQDDLRKVKAAAVAAEARGVAALLTMENQYEPFLSHAVAAVETEKVELHTAIAIAFARSPMVVAEASHSLQTASRGRFVLGLGSQVKGHNERRFSVPWTAPAPRMQEYVEALRAIWRCWERDAKLDYVGKHYQFTLMTPNFKPVPNGLPMVPVTIAAVGSAMIRVAARVCDGLRLHPFCTRAYIEQVVNPEVDAALAENAVGRANFEINGGGFVATGPDAETVARQFEWVRYRIAFYGSTRTYHPVLAVHGLDQLGMTLHEMSKQGAWDRMAAEVPDDVVRLFCAVGTYDKIADAIADRYGGVSDAVQIPPGGEQVAPMPAEVIRDIGLIPTRFEGFSRPW